ncbi:MAG: hypothetical protein HC871_04980 [Rhizobiales bacterium]|nr:hypothetical protein [Hyphomicrobiales bacterium]
MLLSINAIRHVSTTPFGPSCSLGSPHRIVQAIAGRSAVRPKDSGRIFLTIIVRIEEPIMPLRVFNHVSDVHSRQR